MKKMIFLSKGLLLIGALCLFGNASAMSGMYEGPAAVKAVAVKMAAKPGLLSHLGSYLPARATVTAELGSAYNAVVGGLSAAWRGCTKANAKAVYETAKNGFLAIPSYCTKENAKGVAKVAYEAVKGNPRITAAVVGTTVGVYALGKYVVAPVYKKMQHNKNVAILNQLITAAEQDSNILRKVWFQLNTAEKTYDLNISAVQALRGDKRIRSFGLETEFDALNNAFADAREAMAGGKFGNNALLKSTNKAVRESAEASLVAGFKARFAHQKVLTQLQNKLAALSAPVAPKVTAPAVQVPAVAQKAVAAPVATISVAPVAAAPGGVSLVKKASYVGLGLTGLTAMGYGAWYAFNHGIANLAAGIRA